MQTCNITMTPFTDPSGTALVREEKACTVTSVDAASNPAGSAVPAPSAASIDAPAPSPSADASASASAATQSPTPDASVSEPQLIAESDIDMIIIRLRRQPRSLAHLLLPHRPPPLRSPPPLRPPRLRLPPPPLPLHQQNPESLLT